MKKVALLFLLIAGLHAGAQTNPQLKHQLDSIMVLDQKYRDTLMQLMMPVTKDAMLRKLGMGPAQASAHYWKLQGRIDSLNLIFIENTFKQYGYPGKKLVGEPANESAWNVIQHSGKIARYITVIETAANHRELPYRLYAMMLDRHLMDEGKEQIYGTQATCRNLKNGKQDCFIWPVKNPSTVNARRINAGFTTTVEENAKRLGVNYRVVNIKEVK
ncbi:DUF6624 domain-containing protein [Mucilaginibacter sp. PAMB04168]|uniref:DUF6624 domain-containing protein n=1 Tax=Mucilaginibacter sp. PAMB04168 TaxID=3138567 RepID=UPI0031F6C583